MSLLCKTLIIYYVLLLSGQHLSVLANRNVGTRIIGGNVAKSGQFPFMAAINVRTANTTFFCGGALVNEEWVLTSGTCTYEVTSVTITLGSVNLDGEEPARVVATSSDIVVHPEFNPDTLENDIGLVKLSSPVEFSGSIQAIKLATINLPNILTPTALGWGQTSDDSNLASELNYVNIPILTNEDCRIHYGDQINDRMVCLNGNNNEGLCFGDSGSPLVVRPFGASSLQHVAIGSFFGAEGCESSNPSGYTRTYFYLDWIKSVTNAM